MICYYKIVDKQIDLASRKLDCIRIEKGIAR